MLNIAEVDVFLDRVSSAKNDDDLRQIFKSYSANYAGMEFDADPFSSAYASQQFDVYETLTGKTYAVENEVTSFDVDSAAFSPFPYCHASFDTVGNQLQAIGFIIKAMELPKGSSILEFGPGWGNTTIALAKMGYEVTAVDIEKNFVDLIAKRAAIERLPIELVHGDFSHIHQVHRKYDAVLFFECFHHASDHRAIMSGFDHALKPGGIVCFAAEPVLRDFPLPWGLRLDGESLWAIRKNGWLELGFNLSYFREALSRCGFAMSERVGFDSPWSKAIIAKRKIDSSTTYAFNGASAGLRSEFSVDDTGVASAVGMPGFVAFGPYVELNPGRYKVEFCLQIHRPMSGSGRMQIAVNSGDELLVDDYVEFAKGMGKAKDVKAIYVEIINRATNVEFRLFCNSGARVSIDGVIVSLI